jgi:F0F1-type ATP synthase membrane subunit b/b'
MVATITDTTNLFVNLITILVIVAGFWAVVPYARGKRQGQAIEDLDKALNAARKRIDSAEETAREAKDEAQHCHIEMEKWKARYEEAQRYSAREAVEHFEVMMADHSNKVAERHEKMLKHLELQTEASRNLAELIGHNTTLVAAIAKSVGVGS